MESLFKLIDTLTSFNVNIKKNVIEKQLNSKKKFKKEQNLKKMEITNIICNLGLFINISGFRWELER